MSKFQEGDLLKCIHGSRKKRLVVKVKEHDYLVVSKSFANSDNTIFELELSYVEKNYELDPISRTPLYKALR